MAKSGPKTDLLRYLRQGREGLLKELDGLSAYDARRPMTPTATNLLGLVKHVAGVQSDYFGVTFDRAFPEQLAWEEVASVWTYSPDRAWTHCITSSGVISSPNRTASAESPNHDVSTAVEAINHPEASGEALRPFRLRTHLFFDDLRHSHSSHSGVSVDPTPQPLYT